MAEYRLSARAHRDLDEMFDYTVARWGLPQALRYTDLIETACADLAKAPQQAQCCANIRSGYRRRSVEQHVIYFRETSYGIVVIRILHIAWIPFDTCDGMVMPPPMSTRLDVVARQER